MLNNYADKILYLMKHKISDLMIAQKSILDLNEVDEQLSTNGCVVMENFLAEEECKQLLEKSIYIEKKYPERVSLESNNADMRIYGVDRLDDTFKLKSISSITDLWAKKFYRSKNINYFQVLGHIKRTENNIGSGGGWHRDSPFSHQFKFILYINDVTEKNGPFQYIKGSHKTKNIINYCQKTNLSLKKYRLSEFEVNEIVTKSVCNEIITVVGKAGTLLIADVKGLHRGKPLEDGERWATTRYYFRGKIPKYFHTLIGKDKTTE